MAEANLSVVRTLVVEPSQVIQQSVRMALWSMGFRELVEADTLATVLEACRDGTVDLLVLNVSVEGQDTPKLVRELRRGRFGKDPFPVVVMLLVSPSEQQVRDALSCGADDLLLVPMAVEPMIARFGALLTQRKQFVVTFDYIGPDRRKEKRDNSPPSYTVPHPIRARAGGMPASRYEFAVQEVSRQLCREMIRRLAAAIEWEMRELCVSIQGTTVPLEAKPQLIKVDAICEELIGRLAEAGAPADEATGFRLRCKAIGAALGKTPLAELEGAYSQSRRIAKSCAEV